MDEENPSLLGIAQAINQKESKPSIRDGDRTKIGSDRVRVSFPGILKPPQPSDPRPLHPLTLLAGVRVWWVCM